MKTKLFLFSALISTMVLTLVSCKKDKADDPTKTYPKNASIEYKCSVVSGTPTGIELSYTNENGGTERLSNVVLPFSKKISRTVNAYDEASIRFAAFGPAAIKAELYIDGKLVDSKSASSNSASSSFTESVSYIWR